MVRDPRAGPIPRERRRGLGALALPVGTLGDFFRINLGIAARSDRFAISFSDPVQDPILYLIDLQGTGGRVTISPGDTAFTSNPDASWSENVLAVSNGYPSGSASAGSGLLLTAVLLAALRARRAIRPS